MSYWLKAVVQWWSSYKNLELQCNNGVRVPWLYIRHVAALICLDFAVRFCLCVDTPVHHLWWMWFDRHHLLVRCTIETRGKKCWQVLCTWRSEPATSRRHNLPWISNDMSETRMDMKLKKRNCERLPQDAEAFWQGTTFW